MNQQNNIETIGIFKLKDIEGRQAIKIKISGDVREVIIQKILGENNKIMVAVKKGEYEYGEVKTSS